MEYKTLTLLDEIEEALGKNPAMLVYFSAPHCNVCKVLKPKVAEMINTSFPQVKLYYINIEDAPVVSGQFRIFSIPTILIFFEGREYIRKSRNIGLLELEGELSRPYSILFNQ